MGSAALDLCLVAEGKLDAFWEVGLSPWDVAAPSLICKQVGLFIGTYDVVVARFDGSDFHDPVVPDGVNDLSDLHLYDLKVSESGDVWLATSEGLFRQTGSEWIKYAHNDLGVDFFEVWEIEFD